MYGAALSGPVATGHMASLCELLSVLLPQLHVQISCSGLQIEMTERTEWDELPPSVGFARKCGCFTLQYLCWGSCLEQATFTYQWILTQMFISLKTQHSHCVYMLLNWLCNMQICLRSVFLKEHLQHSSTSSFQQPLLLMLLLYWALWRKNKKIIELWKYKQQQPKFLMELFFSS